MVKKICFGLALAMLLTVQAGSVLSGKFFDVTANGLNLTITLNPSTPLPSYSAGIRSMTNGVSITNCRLNSLTGFCEFQANKFFPQIISVDGPSGLANFILCLNSRLPQTCQNYLVQINRELPNDSLNKKIQAVVDSYLANEGQKESSTGLALTISYPKDGQIIQQSFFAGKTSQQLDAKPITASTLFDTGSITKSYTAALILQLEEENLLNINDPIGNWLPQYPMWKDVTIKQLLNMTSGIPNYSDAPEFTNFFVDNLNADLSPEFLLSFAKPSEPIIIGKKFEYSNSNSILASLIIEAVTNQNYNEVLQKRLFEPLALNNSYYAAGPNWKSINETLFPRKAHGYYYDYKTKILHDLTNVNLSWGAAAGAIVSTTKDQIKWVDQLLNGKIFSDQYRSKLLKELKSLVSMKNGQAIEDVSQNDPSAFGLGVARGYVRNQRFWFYEGSSLGYRMMYFWKSCSNVVVLASLNSKGGENDPDSPAGDHIKELLLDSYQLIMEANPNLICQD